MRYVISEIFLTILLKHGDNRQTVVSHFETHETAFAIAARNTQFLVRFRSLPLASACSVSSPIARGTSRRPDRKTAASRFFSLAVYRKRLKACLQFAQPGCWIVAPLRLQFEHRAQSRNMLPE
jgi:hypothetical protein